MDIDDRDAGFYKGWPVAFIERPLNEGHEDTFGVGIGADIIRRFGFNRQIAGRMAFSQTDGRADDGGEDLQLGGFAPIQLHMSADVKWDGWSVSPRLLLVGSQRLMATISDENGAARRRTLDGFALLNINLRRYNVLRNLDAFVTIENGLDRRYRSINLRAFTNPEELIGAPQNPRRVTVGIQVRLPVP